MSLAEYIHALKHYKGLASDVKYHRTLAPSPPRYAPQPSGDPSPARQVLADLGIDRLYVHQHQAVDFIQDGHHTVVATPTASGKSLIYNLPVLDAVISDANARALYLFPLKALARDQLSTLENYLAAAGKRAGHGIPLTARAYDGDLSAHMRTRIRNHPPHILLTNPEMLHLAMLAHHGLWESFFTHLKYVVVDEVHTYRGVMGSHMAWVFRRLIRICRHYGASPVFIFLSATIDNPRELAGRLTGLPVKLVNTSTAPVGRKEVLLMEGTAGAAQTAILLMHAAIHRKLRTIVYTQSRKITELIAMWAAKRAGTLGKKISAYRAGFLPEERRAVEQKLADGRLLAVVSTSALELGIDIGNLDLCILVGYPGSIMSTWQRAGRVGRRGRDSAMIFVAHEDALDVYFMTHPTHLFDMPPEKAVINPANPVIMSRHLVCAAADLPLAEEDPLLAAPGVRPVLEQLEQDALLLKAVDESIWISSRKAPHRHVSLRGTGRSIPIFLSGTQQTLGDVDRHRAFYETHPGAVYLHHGKTYVVDRFDHENGVVTVVPETVGYYTRARSSKSTQILEACAFETVWHTRMGLGRLRVTDQVTGYEKKAVGNSRSLGVQPLDLPPNVFETEGFWIEIPDEVRSYMESGRYHFMGGIHAMEHAMIGILPLLVMTDRNDLGGISIPYHPQVSRAAVFVYDGTPGGIGLARQAFSSAAELLDKTMATIAGCRCDYGCPACVHSPKCGSGNRPIDKIAALKILEKLKAGFGRGGFRSRMGRVMERAGVFGGNSDAGSEASVSNRPERLPRNTHSIGEAAGNFSDGASVPPPSKPEMNVSAQPGRCRRYGVLDLETRRSAAEVGGWHQAHRMGVSCVVVYDSHTDRFNEYLQSDLDKMAVDLARLDLVIGFNIRRFDYKVLSGLVSFDFDRLNTLDILEKVHEKLGYRLSLDRLARETLNTEKSADGLQALKWWKEGRIREIIDYCIQDVRVTRDLYRFGRDHHHLLFRNKAGQKVRLPVSW